MPSSAKARFSTLLRIGLICIIVNVVLLYIIINFVVIPYLDRGRSPEEFEQMFHRKQASSFVHTVETPLSIRTATQVHATVDSSVVPNPSAYFCDTQSCSL